MTEYLKRFAHPLQMASGGTLPTFQVAYSTYGTLNSSRDNAVLVLHGLTTDQHASGTRPDGKPGWWENIIGPGKAVDTDHWYVVCPNSVGSWGGTSGPMTINPETGRPWGLRFPMFTIGDNVPTQAALADELGIRQFQAAIGGCYGGFQVLEWMRQRPNMLRSALILSATPRTSAHNTALWSVLRAAITADPSWKNGDYYDGLGPKGGVGLMAKIGILVWMSRDVFESKFGIKRLPAFAEGPNWGFAAETEVEAFLESVEENAINHIDANSILYMTRAIDYFDLARTEPLCDVFKDWQGATLLVAYKNDWRYPPDDMREIHDALNATTKNCRFEILDSMVGHGGFLYDTNELAPLISDFLN